MNRIIKFRQLFECQNGHKRWAYFHFPSIAEQLRTINDELILEWGERTCDCPTFDLHEGYSPIEEHQQFTGLLDRNKKEIYEGDLLNQQVVQYSAYHLNDKPEEVVFVDGMYCMRHMGIIKKINTLDLVSQDCEIIGNIYENPELLPKEEDPNKSQDTEGK